MITPGCRWLFSPSSHLGATSALSPRADPSQAQSIRSNVTDKCEASHLPSGLRPSAGNLQAGGRGGARDQPEKPAHGARQAQGCGLTALQAAHGTAEQEAGTPGSAHVYPALPRAPALQQPSERWRAPISRVKVQAHGGGALLPAGLCFHLQRNFQEGNLPTPSPCLSLRLWGTRKFPISPYSWRRQTSNAGNLLFPCAST